MVAPPRSLAIIRLNFVAALLVGHLLRREDEGQQELGLANRQLEIGGQHSEDDVRLGVDADGTADGGRICAEARLPEGVREHDGVCIAIGEHAADQRATAEGREKRSGDPGGADLLGRTGERQGGRAGRDQGGIFDGRRLDAAVEIVRDGDLCVVAVLPGVPHEHQPLGLSVGQRPEQDAIEHREDGGVRPGGDGERQDRGDRKGGPVAKGPERVAQVVHGR